MTEVERGLVRTMRAPLSAAGFFVMTAVMIVACGHGGPVTGGPAKGAIDPHATGAAPIGPPQYIVADPSARTNVVAVSVGGGPGTLGLVVDKTRIVIGRGEPKVGPDLPEQTIGGAVHVPGRFGGGFLFWTDNVLYRADTFDGALKPVARLSDGIQSISFAPKYLLARTHNGERWGIAIPSGERMAIDPLGAADVEGLDDGRALAFDDSGAAFSSLDHGAHWTDVTSEVKSSPARVAVVDDELWLLESSGNALRLEHDGHLSVFDKQPPENPPEMRARDPRWRGAESPLRTAFMSGASIDDNTAIVIEQGDLVRIDVHTGELVSIVGGKLPPDARCDAVPTANDVVFACVVRATQGGNGGPSSFVVSHTLSGDSPNIEQTFQTVAPFYGSDDGGLAIAAPCTGAPLAAGDHTVCVRQPGGTWQDYDLSALGGDGGANDVTIARWVPRADGRAVALVTDPAPGIYDPRSGQLEALELSAKEVISQGALPGYQRYQRHGASLPFLGVAAGNTLVDFSWSYSATGSLRGWQRHGGIVELNDGKVVRSPYAFDIVTAGPYALGRTPDGRFYQSTDHGATWAEVAGPPSGAAPGDLRGCSTAGCDLGGFYRVGWLARPPQARAPLVPAKLAPEVRRTKGIELSCRPAGPAQVKVLTRTDKSPDDLGLGNNRLPVANDNSEIAFLRNVVPRVIVNPLHETPAGDSETPSLRGMLTGFATSKDSDVIQVMGPSKSATQLRRGFSFVAPFDPAASVKKATIAMSEVLGAGRLAGLTNDEILQDDMTEAGDVVVLTPSDPALPDDLVFHNARGLVVRVRANERVKIGMRPTQADSPSIVSAVALLGEDAAFLELEPSGVGHVFKIGAAGNVTDLYDVNPTANDASIFYPANPDALATNGKGDLAIIRTGSGSDPPSALDPALLMISAMPPVALAPWSTLKLADDPVCKDPGWRTTVQMIAPWIRMVSTELRTDDVPMIARVKWSDKRVCLEGFEMKLADVSVRAPGSSGAEVIKIATWLVARGSTFARVAIADGLEWRQPLECSFPARTP